MAEDEKKFECIYLEWNDAVAEAEWAEVEEAELFKCKTLGFVVAENDEAICVAAVVSEADKQSNAKIHIPKAWITLEKRLKM
jgi:hypothetical protein|tara:strand:+ start:497 stop:742 length:246 start_codon:yes stop_codon:yes gene_type:complete